MQNVFYSFDLSRMLGLDFDVALQYIDDIVYFKLFDFLGTFSGIDPEELGKCIIFLRVTVDYYPM